MKSVSKSLLPVILALLVAACGGGSGGEGDSLIDDVVESEQAREILITGVDEMKFVVQGQSSGIETGEQIGQEAELERIIASPGETISITLTTRSELPPAAMAHNFVLLELGTDVEQFARESVIAGDNDYIAPAFEDRIIAATSMLAGGESETIEFQVPNEPGEYTFICSFPGHYASGMYGVLVVQ